MLIGVEHIGNADLNSFGGRWLSALGMSVQTLTTVGYGSHLRPSRSAVFRAIEHKHLILARRKNLAVLQPNNLINKQRQP